MSRKLYAAVLGAAVVSTSQAAFAEENQAKQDSIFHANSVNVIDPTDFRTAMVNGVSDLIAGGTSKAYVTQSPFNSSSMDVVIRGVGGTANDQMTGDSAVSVFVDGVRAYRGQNVGLEMIDLEKMEIVTGPAGAALGRNTSGGAIYMTSAKPTGEFGITQELSLGTEYNETLATTHLNLNQVGDLMKAKLSYMFKRNDGWVGSTDGSANNLGEVDDSGFRVATEWTFTDTLSAEYSYENREAESTPLFYQRLANVSGSIGLEPSRIDKVRSGIGSIEESSIDVESHLVKIFFELSDNLRVESISHTSDAKSSTRPAFGGSFSNGAGGLDLTLVDEQNHDQWSQEIKLIGELADQGVQFELGASYTSEDGEQLSTTNIPGVPLLEGKSELDTMSFYAVASTQLADSIDVSLGVRQTNDKKDISRSNGAAPLEIAEIDDDHTDVDLTASMGIGEATSVFASFRTGYKAAGANWFSNNFNGADYQAEDNQTFELGVEGVLSDKWNYVVKAYNSTIKDRQIFDYSGESNILTANVINDSDDANIQGVDVDISASVTEKFDLTASYSFMDADDSVIGGQVYRTAFAPENAYSVSADYYIGDRETGDIVLRVEYIGSGDYVADPLAAVESSRSIFNARVGMKGFELENGSEFELAIWGKNLTDDDYLISARRSNNILGSGAITDVGAFGEPRTIGVDIRWVF